MLFLSQAASVSLWQMLEVNSVSVPQLSEAFLRSQLSWPLPALLAELRLQGCTRPPGEAAGSADARGNGAVGWKAQLELILLFWNKCMSMQPETALLLFCLVFFFSQVFLHCHLGARGWQPSHQTDGWNILMISLKSVVTVYNAFAQNNSSVANCVTYEETFWKAVCLHNVLYSQRSLVCILLLHRMAVHVKTVRQRWEREKKWKYSKSLTPQITASISVVVTSVAIAALCLLRSAVSFFSAACVSVSRLHSVWHRVLWKSSLHCEDGTTHRPVAWHHVSLDNLLMRWPAIAHCWFYLRIFPSILCHNWKMPRFVEFHLPFVH